MDSTQLVPNSSWEEDCFVGWTNRTQKIIKKHTNSCILYLMSFKKFSMQICNISIGFILLFNKTDGWLFFAQSGWYIKVRNLFIFVWTVDVRNLLLKCTSTHNWFKLVGRMNDYLLPFAFMQHTLETPLYGTDLLYIY